MLRIFESILCENSFGFLARARYFLCVDDLLDIKDAVAFAHKKNLPLKVLGCGSNLVLSDNINACVLNLNRHKANFEVIERTKEYVTVAVDGGYNWDNFVSSMSKQNIHGLENLAGIPGTVGAAPVQNIGAYDVAIKDYLFALDWYCFNEKKQITLNTQECCFGYRTSCFKSSQLHRNGVITRVYFRLATTFTPRLTHNKLQAVSPHNITANKFVSIIKRIRRASLPSKHIGSAGSFFVNPIITARQAEELMQKYRDAKLKKLDDNSYKVHAGWLIQKTGWRGYKDGYKPFGIDAKNALVLVNKKPYRGRVSATDIKKLAQKITESVEGKFAIKLQQEPSVW